MKLYISVLYGVFGLVVGSFLNVCIYRIPRGESIVVGRSHCTQCKTPIAPWDLIPVLSFLLLKGRCRHCHAPISPRYPLVELANALLWVLAWRRFGVGSVSLLYALACSTLLLLACIDGETGELPNSLNLTLAIIGGVLALAEPLLPLSSRLLGALLISVPMAILILLTRGFGWGDVKLMAAAGLLLGWGKVLVAFFLGCMACAGVALILRGMGKVTMKSTIPFGPYLAFGIVIAALYGTQMLRWYLGLLS